MSILRLDRETAIAAAPELQAIHESAFAESGARIWSVDELAALCERPTVAVFRSPHGFLAADVVVDEAEVLTFAVAREAQGRGEGRALLDFALVWMGESSLRRCVLEVAEDNAGAIALYRRAQFQSISRRPAYFSRRQANVDGFVMEKLLKG